MWMYSRTETLGFQVKHESATEDQKIEITDSAN